MTRGPKAIWIQPICMGVEEQLASTLGCIFSGVLGPRSSGILGRRRGHCRLGQLILRMLNMAAGKLGLSSLEYR